MGETDQYPDPLEAELVAFRPRPMSPELQSRIGCLLTRPRNHWHWRAAVGVAVAASVLIVVGLIWSQRPRPDTHVITSDVRPSTRVSTNALKTASPPSLMDYQQAFAESSDAFDALLARPAGSGSAPVRAFAFPSPDSINLNNIGDHK